MSSALDIPEVYAVTFLASESDLVIVLAPGGNESFHIMNEGCLQWVKKTAILFNVARGSLVATDALIRVLMLYKVNQTSIWTTPCLMNPGEQRRIAAALRLSLTIAWLVAYCQPHRTTQMQSVRGQNCTSEPPEPHLPGSAHRVRL